MMQLIRGSGSQAVTSFNGDLINLTTEKPSNVSRQVNDPDKLTTIKEITLKTD